VSIAFVDASAVMKLVLHEDGSDQLDEYLGGCSVVASDLAVTEVLRGARRAAAGEAETFSRLVERTMMVMEEMVLITAETTLFARAGLLEGAHLRSLDAVHLATALTIGDVDVFVTYDERQAAAARLAGLRTIAPGV
jgi:predicted nucleic acid-binding protein